MNKICLVSSTGGHLLQLYLFKKWWERYERFWVVPKRDETTDIIKEEKIYIGHFPTTRNLKNLILNTILAIRILLKEKPNIIISTGAAIAVPFFYIGKILGIKLIYVEVYDRISKPTLTGKIVYPITDKFILQWENQKKFYPKGIVFGELM